MSITFSPIWPWPLVILAIISLLAVVGMSYPRRVAHLPPFSRRFLIGLRFAAAVVLALAMLRPAIQIEDSEKNASIVFVLADFSRSMTTQDGPQGISRREALLRTIADNSEVFAEFEDNVEILFYDFARELTAVSEPGEAAEGEQTAIGAVLNELLREARGKPVAGVIVLSDGAQRAHEPDDADPRSVARLFAERRIPIYTVGYGSTGLSDSTLDLSVEDLLVDPLVFANKSVPINAKVRALGAAGRDLTVRLLVEDRSGVGRGKQGELSVPKAGPNARPSMQFDVKEPQEVIPVELSFVPDFPGEYKVVLEVVALDGELKQNNNRLETIITVQKGGIKVKYFDTIRPEQKPIRHVQTSDKIQLDFQLIQRGRFAHLNEIDADSFKPGAYDAYIIGDVPAAIFTLEQLEMLAARAEQGAGLLMTGGFHSFGAGGYARTPLENLLPVAMDVSEKRPDDEVDESLQHMGKLKMLPTRVGLGRFVMRLDSADKNMQRWRALPPLNGATKLRKKNNFIEILAESEEGIPLLFASEGGKFRVAAFAGDTTYLWFQHRKYDEHQKFWRQMILWLSHKEMDGDAPVWVHVDPRNYAPRRNVELTFGARNEEGEPIPDADFDIEVRSPDGELHKLTPQLSQTGGSTSFSETLTPGDYWIRVAAEKDGTRLGDDAWTRFIVDSRDLEMDNPTADFDLLEEIAHTTGGYPVAPEEFGRFLEDKVENGLTDVDLTRFSRVRLWDNWPFLLIFVSIMTLEWYLRKRKGLV